MHPSEEVLEWEIPWKALLKDYWKHLHLLAFLCMALFQTDLLALVALVALMDQLIVVLSGH